MNTIGERVAWLVKQAGVGQTGFARAINVTEGTISTWTTGKRVPQPGKIRVIAEYFKSNTRDMNRFILDGGQPPELSTTILARHDSPHHHPQTEFMKKLSDWFYSQSEFTQEKILEEIDTFPKSKNKSSRRTQPRI